MRKYALDGRFSARIRREQLSGRVVREARGGPRLRRKTWKNSAAGRSRGGAHLIGQRRQRINALRGPLTEFGKIVPRGASDAHRLISLISPIESPECRLPNAARTPRMVLVEGLHHLEPQSAIPDAELARRARADATARRLITFPGIGPLIATAPTALAPPPETFRKVRDFAARSGLAPAKGMLGLEIDPELARARTPRPATPRG